MKPHKFIHHYISKRDSHRKFSNTAFVIVFLALFAVTVFSLRAKADDRSKTEAQAICIDCLKGSLKINFISSSAEQNIEDAKLIPVTIFSDDPSKDDFSDPRKEVHCDRLEDKQFCSIGLVHVEANLNQAPPEVSQSDLSKFQIGARMTGNASGFLINRCLVLTNDHVVNGDVPADKVKNRVVTFTGRDGRTSSGTVVKQGGFLGGSDPEKQKDWAIVKLAEPLGDNLGYLTPALPPTSWATKNTVSSASMYPDKNGGLWKKQNCQIIKENPNNTNEWMTDCPTIEGVSGSPIIALDPKTKEYKAIGIIQGGAVSPVSKKGYTYEKKYSEDKANIAVPLFKSFSSEQLQKIIDDNPCPAQKNTEKNAPIAT